MPRVNFRFSSIYNQHFKEYINLKYSGEEMFFPADEEIIKYIEGISAVWDKIEQDVLSEMSRVSGLSWSMKFLTCYVVGDCVSFSDPLTLRVFENKDRFIDTLVHELIHQLFVQYDNRNKMEEVFKVIDEKFKNETNKTKVHILVHAVHARLYKKLFNEERLNNNIERSNMHEDYRRAWEIVNAEEYENILRFFK